MGLMKNSTCLLQPSSASTVALPIIYSFLFTTGSFGNILSGWIFSKHISTKRTQNIYLTNLGIANLFVCITMPFLAAYFADGYQWENDSMLCKIVHYFGTLVIHTSMYVSITILCWTALSQYSTLMKNNDHTQYSPTVNENYFYKCLLEKFRQPKFAKYLCISIWIIVLGVTVPVIVYDLYVQPDQGQVNRCYHWKAENGELTSKITVLIATAWFFLFFITVLFSYYSLVNYLSKMQKNTCIGKKHLIYSTVKRNIFVILLILTVCFLPYHIFRPVFYTLLASEDCQMMNYLVEAKNFLTCLAAAKSSLDPVVNLLLDKTFKKSLYNLFRKSSSQDHKHTADIEETTQI
ncbi:probable G-protein coupled receptor 82 [Malaclemys terrapin pileata]|uniref:probable G-protein coupled receptor 82 n=1 Tax=Malaclemys terrapin pileata TaxID=2991368 RepID=UPI0023A8E935|nr:probable G-protein coupled receptor 82 [Malaclemys terrapin pileata]